MQGPLPFQVAILRACIPALRLRKARSGILVVNSASALFGLPLAGIYAATKVDFLLPLSSC